MTTDICERNQERVEMEQILLDCINEAKREIQKRRIQQM